MSARLLVALGVLVLAWYLGLTLLPPIAGTCFDGECGFTPTEILISIAFPVAFAFVPIAIEMFWRRRPFGESLAVSGLTRVSLPGLRIALLFALPLILFFPLASIVVPVELRPGWQWLLLGVALNNGLAEETLMRGFVFRVLRDRAPFWRAAAISTAYFAAYHLPLLVLQGPAIGLVSVVLAVPTGFLTAYAYDRGNRTVAGPALIHIVNNGLVYVFVVTGDLQIAVTSLYILTGALAGTIITLYAWRTCYGRSSPRSV